ncbi:MAG: recombinase zinc beta ribbon domain-containing protein, partial [Pseudomonadota bacterium]
GKRGGRELVFDEPVASTVKEALEGFASGRFETQAEVQRFLESKPEFPKDMPGGKIRPYTITRFLKKPIYAGYVESKAFKVSLRPGQHDGIISFETHETIQRRLKDGGYAPARKDINRDFPLRGFVCCGACSKPMTAAWSKGKYRKYPYYKCQTKGCPEHGKSLPRAEVEGKFEDIIRGLTPTDNLFRLVKDLVDQILDQRLAQMEAMRSALRNEITQIETNINELLNRIVETQSSSVISAYENKIEQLEREKFLTAEKLEKAIRPKLTSTQFIELPMRFLSNPWKIWDSGNLVLQRLVLRLVFSERLEYVRGDGYRTPKTTLPFNVLRQFRSEKMEMVMP